MDIQRLEYFVKLAETLHFGRAAASLEISQPQLSRHLQYLEKELGVELLSRTRHHVTLTDAGKAFLPDAQELVTKAHAARAKAQTFRRQGSPRLRVGHTGCELLGALPTLVRQFCQHRPNIALHMKLLPPTAQIDAILEHRLDLGVMPFPIAANSHLAMEVVGEDPLVVAFPLQHTPAKGGELSLGALANAPFVGPRRDPPAAGLDQFLGVCRRAGFEPNIAQEVESPEAALALVEAGLGIALLPAAARQVTHREVRFQTVVEPWARIQCGVAWRRADCSPILLDFLAALRQRRLTGAGSPRRAGGWRDDSSQDNGSSSSRADGRRQSRPRAISNLPRQDRIEMEFPLVRSPSRMPSRSHCS